MSKNHYAMRSFATFLSEHKVSAVFTLLIFVLSNACLALIPVFLGELVDALTNNQSPWLYVWLLIACSSLHDLLWRGAEFSYKKYILPISFSYETLLFKKTIKHSYAYFTNKFTGKISTYIIDISREFRQLLSEGFFSYSGQIVGLVAVIAILSSINWQTGLLFMAGLLGMLITGRVTLKKSMASEKKETDVNSSKSGILIDAISNFASVKSFRKEDKETSTIENEQSKTLEAANNSFFWGIVFWASMSVFVRHFIWPSVVILNVYYYGQGLVSLGQLTTLLSTALIFTNTIWEIIWHISQLGIKLARVEEAHQYLFGKVNIASEPLDGVVKNKVIFEKEIAIHKLSFAYPDQPNQLVINDIDLTLKKGEKVGVVGKSGSGKSTLTKLFLNYYDIPSEFLKIDGRTSSTKELASIVSFVPQDTTLFHRTIAENISYASDNKVSKDEVIAAAKQAHAHEFILQIPGQYNALIGDRGIKLSGGQRQRIAIARAIVQNSPLLILDEATSALDSESEQYIQQSLEALWQDKTALVIAHRLSTISKLDRIIVMDNGTIVEQGSHDKLIARKGVYAKLWAHQSGGFIEE